MGIKKVKSIRISTESNEEKEDAGELQSPLIIAKEVKFKSAQITTAQSPCLNSIESTNSLSSQSGLIGNLVLSP